MQTPRQFSAAGGAFRRNTMTSPRKPDACRTLAAASIDESAAKRLRSLPEQARMRPPLRREGVDLDRLIPLCVAWFLHAPPHSAGSPWRIQCMFCLSCALAPPYGQHLLECDFAEKRDRVRAVAWCSHRTEPTAGSEVADDAVRAAERIASFGIVQRATRITVAVTRLHSPAALSRRADQPEREPDPLSAARDPL
jgi:hypothetical protein